VHYLFDEPGIAHLRLALRSNPLIGLDFDGTLAPLVDDPMQARMSAVFRQSLAALARARSVAIISGRAVHDLRRLVTLDGLFLLGSHGIENGPGWPASAHGYRALTDQWRAQLAQAGIVSERHRSAHGAWLEDKAVSLSVHYRVAEAEPAEAAGRQLDTLTAIIEQLQPAPRIVPGRCLFNLVPPNAPSKGSALAHLATRLGCSHAIFAGDDQTDEDAFRVEHLEVLSVRVGYSPASQARYFLNDQSEVLHLLEALIEPPNGR
jgi:trehalose 6-phosphate phosphatase